MYGMKLTVGKLEQMREFVYLGAIFPVDGNLETIKLGKSSRGISFLSQYLKPGTK